jgi:4-amino-4-deoxy-L-arabinose transferase-like glycosyltransferase
MDEVASLTNAHAFGGGGMKALADADHIAPLYSIILWLVTSIGGESAMTMRMPSVIAGVLTVPIFYVLGVRLFCSRTVGLIGAALVAISPYAVWYGQEARMYALLLLCASTYVVVAWPAVERPLRTPELLALTLVTTIGLYTHHYMILLCGAFGLFLLFSVGITKARAWIWLATQLIAFLAFIYWLVLAENKFDIQVSKPLLILWTPYTLYTFFVGLSFGPSITELRLDGPLPALMHHAVAIGVATLVILVVGFAGLRRALRPDTRLAGIWCIVWTFVPIGLAIIATFVTNISYNVRYLIVSFPPVILLLALAIEQAAIAALARPQAKTIKVRSETPVRMKDLRDSFDPMRWVNTLALLALGVCVVASLFNWYFNGFYAKEDVRAAARFLSHEYTSGTLLIVENSWRIAPILAYYGARLPAEVLQSQQTRSGRTPASVFRELNQLATEPSREVWLLEYRPWETDPTRSVRQRLDATAELKDEHKWVGVSLRRYRTLPPS